MLGKRKYYFDLQVHTARHSPCSSLPPEKLVATAIARGLDGVLLTDHGYCWPQDEIDELLAQSGRPEFVVLSGCEVRTRLGEQAAGDLLLVGVAAAPAEPCALDIICRQVHREGGLVIAPHPYAATQGIRDEVYTTDIDAIEVYNYRYRGIQPVEKSEGAWRRSELAGVAGSDAHSLAELGRCCTEFDVPIGSLADLIEAILERRCRPRPKAPPSRLWRALTS